MFFWDRWLPDLSLPIVESINNTGAGEVRVSDLFLPNSRQWDDNILKVVFSQYEIELIKKIPLRSAYRDDCWLWWWDSRGIYTVRSGYKFFNFTKAIAASICN